VCRFKSCYAHHVLKDDYEFQLAFLTECAARKKSEEFPIKVKQASGSAKIYHTLTGKGYDSFTLFYWQDSRLVRIQ
jgi:hypothetical protein